MQKTEKTRRDNLNKNKFPTSLQWYYIICTMLNNDELFLQDYLNI